MIRIISRILAAISLLLLASWLVRDASTFALRGVDRESGRGRGCYTDVELMLGVHSPTNWVRPTELALALVFGVSAFVILLAGNKSK